MSETVYFDTPERAERLQLLSHLINNTHDMLYLRGPHGAGKTRFAEQLAAAIEPDYQVAWLAAGNGVTLAGQLPPGLRTSGAGDAELDLIVQSESERPALLIVDDADAIRPEEFVELEHRMAPGSRLLLLGTGAPMQVLEGKEVQFVDLPPFSEDQAAAFLRAQGASDGVAVSDVFARSLHRAARGLPGPLLDALAAFPPEGREPPKSRPAIPWPWALLAAVLVSMLIAVLVFQDRINAWFQPPQTDNPPLQAQSPEDSPVFMNESEVPPVAVQAPVVLAEPLPKEEAPAPMDAATPPESLPGMAAEPVAEEAPTVVDEPTVAVDDSIQEEPADPVLDAVIDAAISAAAQPPRPPETAGVDASASVPSGSPEATPREVAPPAKQEAAPTIAKPKSRPVPKPAAPKAPGRPPASGLAWLRAQPPGHYTLQLVGSRDRASVDRFIRRHRIGKPYAVFARKLAGKPWYTLVSGSYADRDAAVAARKRLPKGISGVWPRTFGSIMEQLAEE